MDQATPVDISHFAPSTNLLLSKMDQAFSGIKKEFWVLLMNKVIDLLKRRLTSLIGHSLETKVEQIGTVNVHFRIISKKKCLKIVYNGHSYLGH